MFVFSLPVNFVCLVVLAAKSVSGHRFRRGVPVRCCCRGPLEDQCLPLSGDYLVHSRNPFKRMKAYCPSTEGYHHFSAYFTKRPGPCANTTDSEIDHGTVVKVKAFWVRHGWSCANALQESGKSNAREGMSYYQSMMARYAAAKFFAYEDPGLTTLGVRRAAVIGNVIKDKILADTGGVEPMLFSSSLVRAMETALWNFPGWKLRPIPYIAEQGIGLDNQPLPWETQKSEKMKRQPNNETMLKDIIFDVNPTNHPDRNSYSKSDYDAFTRYFPAVLEDLVEQSDINIKEEIPVVIVSHSGYMKANLECKGIDESGKPRNNEVWVQSYTVDLGAYNAVLKPAGCEKLLDGLHYPLAPSTLCENDVSRCGTEGSWTKPTAWINRDKEKCDAMESTDIIHRDTLAAEPYIRQKYE